MQILQEQKSVLVQIPPQAVVVIQIAFGLFKPLPSIVALLLVQIAPQAQSVNLALYVQIRRSGG